MALITMHSKIPMRRIPDSIKVDHDVCAFGPDGPTIFLSFDQLPVSILGLKTENGNYPLIVVTDDLKPQLDEISENFFSMLYPDASIIQKFDIRSNALFYLTLTAIFPTGRWRMIADAILSPDETDYMGDILVDYAAKHNFPIPDRPLNSREYTKDYLKDILVDHFYEGDGDSRIPTLFPLVCEDLLDMLKTNEEYLKSPEYDENLIMKYFWEIAEKKLGEKPPA